MQNISSWFWLIRLIPLTVPRVLHSSWLETSLAVLLYYDCETAPEFTFDKHFAFCPHTALKSAEACMCYLHLPYSPCVLLSAVFRNWKQPNIVAMAQKINFNQLCPSIFRYAFRHWGTFLEVLWRCRALHFHTVPWSSCFDIITGFFLELIWKTL